MIEIKFNTMTDVYDFVHAAGTFAGDVDVQIGSLMLDGKSIMGVIKGCVSTEPILTRLVTYDKAELSRFEKEMERFS